MNVRFSISLTLLAIIIFISCSKIKKESSMRIIFLHHSTGNVIWNGGEEATKIVQFTGRISSKLADFLNKNAQLPSLFREYNKNFAKNYIIKDNFFPKTSPYGWNNYPFDYYNIWVKNAGDKPFMEEPTLEILTKDYKVIIFKHCFPVSNIKKDLDEPDINSDIKTISNYKLQYNALRDKLHQFSDTKFILFTGAAQVKDAITEEETVRAKEFYKWVVDEWDLPSDNIFLWDLYGLQTEEGLYFKDEYAVSSADAHPNKEFAARVVPLLFNRIIDVIENNGNGTYLTGEHK